MPRSRRSKVVSLTKTAKKTLEHKKKLVQDIRTALDEYKYVWLFSVGDMRNDALQDVRKEWKGTGRLIYGKNKVVAKALGLDLETEYKSGLSSISHLLNGQVGLFLTSHPVDETLDWFQSYTRPSFSRMGELSTMDLVLPAGPILNFEGEKFPHSMEPQLRSCGLHTTLEKGVPSLKEETNVVKKGEKLTQEKARLVMMLGYMMATFRVKLGSRWSEEGGFAQGDDLTSPEFAGVEGIKAREAELSDGEDDDDAVMGP